MPDADLIRYNEDRKANRMERMGRWLLDGTPVITNAHFISEFNQKSFLNCSKVASALICKSDLFETVAVWI